MEFFNQKEEVLELQLTEYGKYLLSQGALDPSYYAFFDDDILYDSAYTRMEGNELQNDIEEAKLLPPAAVERKEYDLNHAWMMDHVSDLEEDVKDLNKHIEDLQKDLYSKKDR